MFAIITFVQQSGLKQTNLIDTSGRADLNVVTAHVSGAPLRQAPPTPNLEKAQYLSFKAGPTYAALAQLKLARVTST
jgi:hypothetical protein